MFGSIGLSYKYSISSLIYILFIKLYGRDTDTDILPNILTYLRFVLFLFNPFLK